MSRQYFDDSYGPSRRRVTVQPRQSTDNASRRYMPPTTSDFVGSTFQPNRVRNYPPPPPPPPPSSYYRGEHYPSDGYPNSTRSSSNRVNVCQRIFIDVMNSLCFEY